MKKPLYTYPVRFLCIVLCGVVLAFSLWHLTGNLWPGQEPALDQQQGLAWMEKLAAEPHPRGSAAHQAVRKALLAGLSEAGFPAAEMLYEVTTQDMRRFRQDGIVYANSQATNLLVVVPGTRSDALLVMAHYDSTPMGPGASDGMAGVVNMLLVLEKIQRDGLTFENTLLFLFTDGGEEGRLGAELFAENRVPLEVRVDGQALTEREATAYRGRVLDVKMALNFSARGTGGVMTLFETGAQNLRTMEAFGDIDTGVAASGLSGIVYKLTGEETDLTPFIERNLQGLNFANIGKAFYHHTQSDDVAHLRGYTLAQSGNILFRCLAQYGNLSLDTLGKAGGDAIIFDYLGMVTAVAPRAAGWIWAGILVILFIFWAARTGARRSSGVLFRNLFLGLFILLLGLAAGGCAIWGAGYLFSALSSSAAARIASPLYISLPLWAGMCLLGGFAALICWGGLGKLFSISGRTIRENASLLLCLLGVVCAFLLPAASYLFLPAGLVGLMLMILATFRTAEEPPPFGLYALVFAVFGPLALSLSYMGLSVAGAPVLPYLALPVLLCGAFLLPYAMDIPTRRRVFSWLVTCTALLLLGILCLGVEAVQPAASDAGINLGEQEEGFRPAFDDDRLLYEMNTTGNKALLRIRDVDMLRALGRDLRILGFHKAADGWTLEVVKPEAGLKEPRIAVRYTESINRTTITIRKAYPESVFELHIPTLGVTSIAYEDDRGNGSVTFDPISAGVSEYRIFQSRKDATVTISAQMDIGDIQYIEYLPDAEILEGVAVVEQVKALSPAVRPQLNLLRTLNPRESSMPAEMPEE